MGFLKGAGGAVLVFVGGLIGLLLTFGDPGPQEGYAARLFVTVGYFLVAGLGTGWLFGRRWPFAVLLCWGALAYGLLGLLRRLDPAATRPAWSLVILLLVVPPLLLLPASYLGSRLRIRGFLRERLERTS